MKFFTFKKRQKREPWTVEDHFKEVGEDSSYPDWTCKFCGYTFTTPARKWDDIEAKMEKHLMCYHIQ